MAQNHPFEGQFVVVQRAGGPALDDFIVLTSLRAGTADVVVLSTEDAPPYPFAPRVLELRPGPLGGGASSP